MFLKSGGQNGSSHALNIVVIIEESMNTLALPVALLFIR
jgi:hypothetical protein